MSSTSTSGQVANESPTIAQNPRNFASTPRPISCLSNDDKVQPLSSINGHILPPCLVKIPPRWRFLARSRVARAPLVPNTGKNNMPIGFTYPLCTTTCCLVAIGCSHGHDLGIYNGSTCASDLSRNARHRPPRAIMWPPNLKEMHESRETLLQWPVIHHG